MLGARWVGSPRNGFKALRSVRKPVDAGTATSSSTVASTTTAAAATTDKVRPVSLFVVPAHRPAPIAVAVVPNTGSASSVSSAESDLKLDKYGRGIDGDRDPDLVDSDAESQQAQAALAGDERDAVVDGDATPRGYVGFRI